MREANHRDRVIRGPVASEHVVQLFDTTESLADAVAAFFHEGYRSGANLLLLAKPQNIGRISAALYARGCPVDAALDQGRLMILEAAPVLAEVGGAQRLSAALFDNVIGARVLQLSAGAPLRIYGELVDLLAEQGDYEAALRLEELWNLLSEQCSFELLCGYSSAHFGAPGTDEILHRICAAHSARRASREDALGEWLLATRA